MSKMYQAVSNAVVMHRMAEAEPDVVVQSASYGLTVAAAHSVLDGMRAVGVVPAVAAAPGPAEQALAELLTAYRDGTHQHIQDMRVAWPPLLAALEKLAQLHPPVSDPLMDIVKGIRP